MAKRSRKRIRYAQPRTEVTNGAPSALAIFVILVVLIALVVSGLQLATPQPVSTPPPTPIPASMAPTDHTEPHPGSAGPAPSEEGWAVDGEGRRLGEADAPVVIEMWNDLSCRECRQWSSKTFLELLTREIFAGDAHVVAHDYLSNTPESAAAVRAAWAADQQGRYWDYYLAGHLIDLEGGPAADGDVAFTLDLASRIATDAGLDVDKFRADFSSDAASEAVEQQREAVSNANIEEAPVLIINTQRLVAPTADEVTAAIEAALSDDEDEAASAEPSAESSPSP